VDINIPDWVRKDRTMDDKKAVKIPSWEQLIGREEDDTESGDSSEA